MQAQNAVIDFNDPAKSGRLDSSTVHLHLPENLRSPPRLNFAWSDRPGSGATAADKNGPDNCGISRAGAATKPAVPPTIPEVSTHRSPPGHNAGSSRVQLSTRLLPYVTSVHRIVLLLAVPLVSERPQELGSFFFAAVPAVCDDLFRLHWTEVSQCRRGIRPLAHPEDVPCPSRPFCSILPCAPVRKIISLILLRNPKAPAKYLVSAAPEHVTRRALATEAALLTIRPSGDGNPR